MRGGLGTALAGAAAAALLGCATESDPYYDAVARCRRAASAGERAVVNEVQRAPGQRRADDEARRRFEACMAARGYTGPRRPASERAASRDAPAWYPAAMARIRVIVSGAVESGGPLDLDPGASLATALRAAGGLAWRPHARPQGQLVLRRRRPTSRRVEVHRWNIFQESRESWGAFALENRDVVIVGWSLDAGPG